MTEGKLTFIGLGLYDEKDISLKGLDEIKNCNKVYAEFYTAKLVGTDIDKLESTIGKKIKVLTREETEKGDNIINSAKKENVVFLTCGDSMTATTHVDLRLRAINEGIKTKVVHGSSIVTAVPGLLGLQNYKFGRTTTLAYPEEDYFPTSQYDIIKNNKEMGLHTLVLLDIQTDRNKHMTANEGMELLLEMEKKKRGHIFAEESVICVVARAGSSNPTVRADKIEVLKDEDFGTPLHTLVIPGTLHFMEIEALENLADLPVELSKKLQKL
ncbi:MAG: diphthine synthase [Candidatus Thermoplasmatota archaeon]|nr:diphthine synthase [Candidatus Thermoplasmatota archaeon]